MVTSRSPKSSLVTRRTALKGLGAIAGAAASTGLLPGLGRYIQVQSSEPIKIGFQVHRTGIGAAYGRWYEQTSTAAVKLINESGGIGGRQIEMITEDDGTDPKRGAEVVEKFATQHKVDFVFGTLFSHVVIGSAPRAGELKMPYFVVSEGHHVASGALNRYVFQPGITDVRAQVSSMAPWVSQNLGKKVTMISRRPWRSRAARLRRYCRSRRPNPPLPSTSRRSPAIPTSSIMSWWGRVC